MATSEATAGQKADRYGQFHPVETIELISRKQIEFDEELKKLTDDELASVKQAEDKCPELLTDSFKLKFLRCEVFNADLAAKRYAHYWDKRIEIFGKEKAFLPLTLDGALKDDWVALTLGFVQLVPDVTDPSGRAILFVNPGKLDKSKCGRLSMVRAQWYMVHAALEQEDAQKRGVVLLSFGHHAKFAQFDPELIKMLINSMQGVMPVRVAAIHLCRPPSFFRFVFAIMSIFMNDRLKKRFLVHPGREKDVLARLSTYDLEKNVIPTELGGDITLNTTAWLEKRKSEGM